MTAAIAIQTKPVPTACPVCGGKLWDNRASKKSPNQPDFKCRDKGCDTPVWGPKPPRDKWVWADAAPAAAPLRALPPSTPQPVSYGAIPELDGPLPQSSGITPPTQALKDVFALHETCIAHALHLGKQIQGQGFPVDGAAIAAIAATALIQANGRR